MRKKSMNVQIRLLEIYSATQGVLLALLVVWFRFGPQVIHMEVPPDAESVHQLVAYVTYGLLAFIAIAIFVLTFVKSKLRKEILGTAKP